MMPTTPWVLGRTPAQPVSYSPLFGEHCEEVFAEELGIGPEEYKRLEADGVTGDEDAMDEENVAPEAPKEES